MSMSGSWLCKRLSGFFQSEAVSSMYEQLQVLPSLRLPVSSLCNKTVLLYCLTRAVS